MFSHYKKMIKTISGLLTGLILLVVVFIFVCPMGNMSNMTTAMSVDTSALCAGHTSGNILPAGMDMSRGCFGFHFSIIQQFTKVSFEKVSVFFLLVGILGLYSLIVRKISFEFLKSRLTRFRQHFYHYFEIRRESQKKFLAWLLFVNNYSI